MSTDAAPSARADSPASESGGESAPQTLSKRKLTVLVVAAFVAGLCSILYELLIGTVSSYFLGDSVRQFSITIGLFMAAMGMGAFLARSLEDDEGAIVARFVAVETALGLIGGLSVPVLYACFGYTDLYYPAMVVFIVAIGVLTGLEVPLLVLVTQRMFPLAVNLSNILSLDYLGALAATLLFPFVLLPSLGTFRSALVVGAINLVTALLVRRSFRDKRVDGPARGRGYALAAVLGLVLLAAGFVFSSYLLAPWHDTVYRAQTIYSRQSPYQSIVLTRYRGDLRMYLSGHLQFASLDEYRYHEALVHPAMAVAPQRGNVLLLGAGDGLAVRELLAYDDIERITLVDLDPAVTELAREHPLLRELNGDSLRDERVRVIAADAFLYLDEQDELYDVIIADLPDPANVSLARLYSREFYGLVAQRLARTGVYVTQASSPYYAQKAFWTIRNTIAAAGFETWPYHAYVPSFGDWGFVMAARAPLRPAEAEIAVDTRYVDSASLPRLFVFEPDVREAPEHVSTLDDPSVLGDYLEAWGAWRR